MAKQTINIGSAELAGDGESLRSAFDKINDNFDELYTSSGTTLGSDTSPALGGNLDLSGNDITGIGNLNITGNITATGSISASLDYSNLTNTPTTIAGYGISDPIVLSDTSVEAQPIRQYYADQAAFPSAADWHGAIAHSHADGSLYFAHGGVWKKIANDADAFDSDFSNLTNTPTTLAGYGITDAVALTGLSVITASAGSAALSYNNLTGAFTFTPPDLSSYLTSYTETDPVVGAITGIVKADGAGNISAAVAGTDYLTTVAFADLTSTPTTIAGYGITDAFDGAFGSLSGTPTTLSGYGITDALTAGGALTGSSLEAVAVGAGVADGNDLAISGGDATELNSTGGDANITGGSGALQPGNVNIGATQTTLVTIGSGSNNVDFASGTAVDFTGTTVTGLTTLTGDVTGSVFADDSTLLVDGVNGTLNSSALTKPIALADNEKITFGDGDDLQIYHSGGQNLIAGTATTILTGNWLYLRKSGTAENYLVCKGDGAVELYYDNVKKLETTTDGVAVTGKITGLTDPTDAQDAATKAYVDANSGGGGGSGLQSRGTVTGTTSSLADAAEADLDITGFKSYALLSITTDRAARVRLYVTDATRTADASRAEGVDPTSDAGLIAEVITTTAETVIISPGAFGFNLESSPTTTIPCRVTNKSGGASTVQVDLNILQLEA